MPVRSRARLRRRRAGRRSSDAAGGSDHEHRLGSGRCERVAGGERATPVRAAAPAGGTDEELVLYAYGTPPESERAEILDSAV